jgi:hypothetical protein
MLAYAPPELSEPAITRIRFGAILKDCVCDSFNRTRSCLEIF